MNKYCIIDFHRCNPKDHDPAEGKCMAAEACTRKLLEQEDKFDSPLLLSSSMCTGCGKCVAACPSEAMRIIS